MSDKLSALGKQLARFVHCYACGELYEAKRIPPPAMRTFCTGCGHTAAARFSARDCRKRKKAPA